MSEEGTRIDIDIEGMFGQEKILKHILHYVREIAHDLRRKRIQSATLTLKGETDMPATIQVGKTATATYLEWSGPNGTGSQVPPVGAVAYSSDNAAVATVDPVTGICTGVSAGTANISANDAGLAAPGLPASDVLTVVAAPPPPAVSSTLGLVANSSARAQASRR